jgi:crotonobetainyl-CoA:carnitine CoA-transferase CaiB-like acyl-CoA transferase
MHSRLFLSAINQALGAGDGAVTETGAGALPSVFAVTDLAAASIAAAGLAASRLIGLAHGATPPVSVDRRLASIWFRGGLQPQGWQEAPAWDPIAGDYPTRDGWIRLHTNAPHHRSAALSVLGVAADRADVARTVAGWDTDALEAAVVAAQGAAAGMRSAAAWAEHPQGQAVAAEPLVAIETTPLAPHPAWTVPRDRPLRGVRVLDLTRVLAGPVATRFLAGLGADVLRIDPPTWDEPGVLPTVMLGKRSASLDLQTSAGRDTLARLLAGADVLVSGYRADALDRLGFGLAQRQALRPGLVDVALDAYGWTGPWRHRRGFDSLVQMSSGIAEAGMRRLGKDRPFPLPVQALDHAAGYILAAAALTGIAHRLRTGLGWVARSSLARLAALLVAGPAGDPGSTFPPESPEDFSPTIEQTSWGPARRALPPVGIEGAALRWDLPARTLGSDPPAWP